MINAIKLIKANFKMSLIEFFLGSFAYIAKKVEATGEGENR